ncbi:MAG TPA: TolC family protein [Candidatus Binataceae bacterium]
MKIIRSGSCAAMLLFCVCAISPTAIAQTGIAPGEHLTLERAIEITLRNHPRGRAARLDAVSAAERIGEAKSQLMPQVYGSAQYLGATDNAIGDTSFLNPGFIPRITGTDHDRPANAGQSFAPENNYAMAVGAYQYLLDFGRDRGFVEQRQYESAAAAALSRLTDLDLVYEAAQRYFGLLAAHQKVKVFEKAVAQRNEQLHAAQVKADAGLVPQIDVYTAQAELARAKVARLDAQNEVQTAKVALDNSMALGTEAPDYQLAGVLSYQPISGNTSEYFAAALRLRPDLQAIEDQARAQGAIIQQFRSDFFPTVHAVAGYNAMGTSLPLTNNFDAGIMITWPIFNGFETEHQIDEAKLHRDSLRFSIEDLRQRIFLEVKSAFLDWQTALERIHRTELTLAASSAQLELANKRYDAGLGNIIELTDAERSYVDDDAAYVDALYGYAVAKAALDRSTAQSLERQ